MIRLAATKKYTVVDGRGCRYSVYFQGCSHNCEGCHNQETHDPNGGYNLAIDRLVEDIMNTKYISGVTLTGGDPLFQYQECLTLARLLKEKTSLDIILYTGYTFEEIEELFTDILEYIDYVVDGKYDVSKKSYDLYFAGSTNQRYVDVEETKRTGRVVVLVSEYMRHRKS